MKNRKISMRPMLVFTVYGGLLAAGCGKNVEKVSQTVGPEGGWIKGKDVELIIPPYALKAPTLIEIRDTGAPPSGVQSFSNRYHFEPTGLRFARPIYVKMNYHGGATADLAWSKRKGVGWDYGATIRTPTFVIAPVDHFSDGFIGPPPPCDYAINAGTLIPAGTRGTSLSTGDINADEIPDIIVSGNLAGGGAGSPATGGIVELLFGVGDGTFRPPVQVPVGEKPVTIFSQIADINLDGVVDFIVGSTGPAADPQAVDLTLMLGGANGSFTAQSIFRDRVDLALGPHTTALAPFGNQGRPTLAVATKSHVEVFTFTAPSNGPVAPTSTITFDPPAGEAIKGVLLDDLDYDFKSDLIVLSSGPASSTVSTALGKGDGTFQPPSRVAAGPNADTLAVLPLWATGRRDLAVGSDDGVKIHRGVGDGTLLPAILSATDNTAHPIELAPSSPGRFDSGVRQVLADGNQGVKLTANCNPEDYATYQYRHGNGPDPQAHNELRLPLPVVDHSESRFNPLNGPLAVTTTAIPPPPRFDQPPTGPMLLSFDANGDLVPDLAVASSQGVRLGFGFCAAPFTPADGGQPDTGTVASMDSGTDVAASGDGNTGGMCQGGAAPDAGNCSDTFTITMTCVGGPCAQKSYIHTYSVAWTGSSFSGTGTAMELGVTYQETICGSVSGGKLTYHVVYTTVVPGYTVDGTGNVAGGTASGTAMGSGPMGGQAFTITTSTLNVACGK